MEFSIQDLLPNVTFKTSRSGGKGGQHVNKVSSKVEVNYDIESSGLFNTAQKERLKQKFAKKMTAEGEIQVISEEERSQFLNKVRALEKLQILIKNALHVQKARKVTKPTKSAIERRLKNKQLKAVRKISRRKGDIEF